MNSVAPASADGDGSIWDCRQTPLRCIAILPEAPDVKTFRFVADDGSSFRYKPGQFVTLELPTPGGPLSRTYTLSSTPSRPHIASVTVKAQPGSLGSRWLLDRLKVGDRLKVQGPAGRFVLPPNRQEPLLLLSAGSGATPMLSMTRWLYDTAERADVVYLHFARLPADLLFREELSLMARQLPGLKLRFVVEDDGGQPWTGATGRLSSPLLSLLCPDFAARDTYCCGPAPFMAAGRAAIQGARGSLDRYYEESFEAPPSTPAPPLDAGNSDAGQAELRFARSNAAVRIDRMTTILDAANAAGRNIPYACRMGLCGTCKVRKLSGEVRMAHDGGISEADIADGFILACCSTPLGEAVVLDL